MSRPNLSDVLSKISTVKRAALVPEVIDGDTDASASRFSGRAGLPSGEQWPACSHCNEPLQLFLQLNLENLASNGDFPLKEGLLQVFYCTNSEPHCEVECEAFFPFAKSTLLRVVMDATQDVSSPAKKNLFPPKTIIDWKSVDDYPNWEELEDLGIELSEDEMETLEEEYPLSGEKLFGWPMWVQGVEYPSCPICEETMKLLFQIDSDGNLPYMFGDVGCGHVTYCSNHPTTLAFGWACS